MKPLPDYARVGSSPLTRGKRVDRAHGCAHARLIPAHAGKTRSTPTVTKRCRAHPRSRGENVSLVPWPAYHNGSSPLTRGKRPRTARRIRHQRLIPAHAGKTAAGRQDPRRSRAHPRSRGENADGLARRSASRGSSPLTRGKLDERRRRPDRRRLIPAHAGKTLPDLRFYCADRSDLGNP